MNIVGIGKSLTERINEGIIWVNWKILFLYYSEAPEGAVAIWPVSSKGAECVWRLIPERLKRDWNAGYIKVSKNKSKANPNEYSIQYLPEGVISKIKSGELEVLERNKGTNINIW